MRFFHSGQSNWKPISAAISGFRLFCEYFCDWNKNSPAYYEIVIFTCPKTESVIRTKILIMKYLYILLLLLVSNTLLPVKSANGQTTENISAFDYQYEKPADGVLRILTYNVRNGKGMDEITDYNRVASVIEAIHPEVVALQELDSVTTRSNGVDVLKTLAEKCGMKSVYGASISYRGGKYGIGILSREKPLTTSFIPLPGIEEKRGLLMAEFKDYILFCTHLSLTEADRIASVKLIDQKAKELQKRVFLAGDLNTSPNSEAVSLLSEHWINLSGIRPTFPSSGPTECIDYIWGVNCLNYTYSIIKQEVVPDKSASDHRPVFIDVSIR